MALSRLTVGADHITVGADYIGFDDGVAAADVQPSGGVAIVAYEPPALSAGADVSPSGGVAVAVYTEPSLLAGANVAPSGGGAVATYEPPIVSAGVIVQPSGGVAQAVYGAPALMAGADVQPSGGVATAFAESPAVTGAGFVQPSGGVARATYEPPTILAGANVAPSGGVATAVYTAPTIYAAAPLCPVELDEAKEWLRVDHDAEDRVIRRLVEGAARTVEKRTGLVLCPRTETFVFSGFGVGALTLERRPVRSVLSVQYLDSGGALQELDPAAWTLILRNGVPVVSPAATYSWPMTYYGADDAVIITAEVGYASNADVPDDLKNIVMAIVAHLYDNRDGMTPEFSRRLDDMLQPYRLWLLA